MLPTDPAIYLTPLALVTLVAALFQVRKNQRDLAKRQKEIDQKIYETLILREIGERIGYELNIEKILETIVSSLTKLLPYSAASYQLIALDQSKVGQRFHLEESVNRNFLETMREHMLSQMNKIAPRQFSKDDVLERVTGTIVDEGVRDGVGSLWIAPITINSRGLGVLAIASKKPGLYRGEEMAVLVKILAQASRAVNNLERVIASEEESLSGMVASMADGVVMLDRDLNLAVINPAAVRLLGLAGGEKPGMFEIAKALAQKVDLRAKVEESVGVDRLVTVENLVIGDNVSRLLISPVKDSSGAKVGTVILFHDVTAQKELERLREEFTAMMVHELRAPLTVVRGSTDMFLKNPTLAIQPQGRELLATTMSSAGAMLSLVNDLLDVAKIEAGKFQVFKTAGSIGVLVADRVAFFRQLAEQKGIALSADVSDSNLTAQFDKERLSQVLNNLLSNAVKFTSQGGKITVSAYRVNCEADIKYRFPGEVGETHASPRYPAILVSVADSGQGVAHDRLPELFFKFKQLPRGGGGHEGTGLGLVIAKGVVESHGGQIFVESKEGEGATFHFTIPLDF